MSIIERVTELLGPHGQETANKPDKSGKPGELNLIEKALREVAESSASADRSLAQPQVHGDDPPEDAELVAKGNSRKSGISGVISSGRRAGSTRSGRIQPTVKIDRAFMFKHGLIDPDGARTPVAECFRMIKSQILLNLTESEDNADRRMIMLTSSLPEEGKTFCAVNLAISIALERNRSVLLVDGDVANPSVPRTLGLNLERGLMDVLLDPELQVEDVLCKTDIGKLSILPAGSWHQHATELLRSDAMQVLVEEIVGRYDDRIVVFDAPPLLVASESGSLANHAGQIVMVVEAGKTPKRAIEEALGRIDTRKLAGMLLNKGRGSRQSYGYPNYA